MFHRNTIQRFSFLALSTLFLSVMSALPAAAYTTDPVPRVVALQPIDDGIGPPPLPSAIYISSPKNGRVADIHFRDEDILRFDMITGEWSLYFDGSDVGLANADVDAIHLMDDGSILLSFEQSLRMTIDGQREPVDDSDIVRFVPTQLGTTTIGTFARVLTGSEVGLERQPEDIDALTMDADGNLLISTIGTLNASGLRLLDDDVAAIHPDHSMSQFFDGSDIDLIANSEDIGALALAGDWLAIGTKGPFEARSANVTLYGNAQDLILCALIQRGADTECLLSYLFDASVVGLRDGIDGLAIEISTAGGPGDDPGLPPLPPVVQLSSAGADALQAIEQFEAVDNGVNQITDDQASADYDAEMDRYDQPVEESAQMIYLPVVLGSPQ